MTLLQSHAEIFKTGVLYIFMQNKRRVLLISYEDLQKTKLKKLLKISEKIFIFCPYNLDMIDYKLVSTSQNAGSKIKWERVPKDYKSLFGYFNFYTGMLNQKLHTSFEICILSNNKEMDPLINNLNKIGRSAIRIKDKSPKKERKEGTKMDKIELSNKGKISSEVVKETAHLTVRQLEASGNRPAEAASLKNYILLNSKEEGKIFDILDEVIFFMEENDQISIEEGVVSYNF